MAHESQCPISEHESFDLQTVIEQAGIVPSLIAAVSAHATLAAAVIVTACFCRRIADGARTHELETNV
jgi:hypothetical protein